jgi:hypothetical protein
MRSVRGRLAGALAFTSVLCLQLGSSVAGAASMTASHSAAGLTARASSTATAGPVDADTLPKGGTDATTTFRWLNPGKYQLEIQNTSGIGFIDTFSWVPPVGMTVTAVTSSEGARCSVANGDIFCSGKVAPPQCTCLPGGVVLVNFTATGDDPTFANGYWTYYGIVGSYTQIQTMTPVPYHIPSFLGGAVDLPPCTSGQKSTKANPCASNV